MHASRHAHDRGSTVGFTLLAGGFIFGGIPLLPDLNSCGIRRDAREVAFRWCDHPPAPVLGHDGYPVAGEIDGRCSTRCLRRLRSLSPAPTLSTSTAALLGLCGQNDSDECNHTQKFELHSDAPKGNSHKEAQKSQKPFRSLCCLCFFVA